MPNLIMKAYRSLKLSNHTERAMVVGTIEVLMDIMDAVWGKDANLAIQMFRLCKRTGCSFGGSLFVEFCFMSLPCSRVLFWSFDR
jgi:hypothetical protein